ncbi:hypothetical protein C8046_11115 [Serinibacter arcticus]|uniref:MFS transporter n=1 Tax=Serinibacter arcticus TaxID=1655435 RepID=A0A2U1ZVX0_9MICO|nr:MFS transporter [Serinibacter arcticus]PWD51114.1 hypothetical protein C8046_11115 [Serinibacter arcticus]
MTRTRAQAATSLIPFVLVCLQLQIPTVALGPVLLTVQQETGLDGVAAGALTSIPVLCFAILTPVASRIVGAIGVTRALTAASLAVGLGVVLRSLGPVPTLFAGSVLLGSAVAVVNIAIPTLVTRRYRHRALLMNGIQTASTNIGSALSAAVSAPLVALLGWQLGLAIWSATSFLAAVVWWVSTRGERVAAAAAVVVTAAEEVAGDVVHDGVDGVVRDGVGRGGRTTASGPSALRLPIAWVLGLTFAMHGMCYFAMSSWLPTLLQERSGLTADAAGVCVSVFMALGIAGPLLLPVAMRVRGVSLALLMTVLTAGWLVCMVLLLTAPDLWLAALLVGGLAQGATFTMIVTFGVHVARDEHHSRGIQTVLQTVGFAGAALGPVLIGGVRDTTGSWTTALAVLVGVATALVALGLTASALLRAHDRALPVAEHA